MLILNEKYAIKEKTDCFAICTSNKNKETGEIEYYPKYYFMTLIETVQFLIDRAIKIPKNLKLLAQSIEDLKNDVQNMLKNVTGDRENVLKETLNENRQSGKPLKK